MHGYPSSHYVNRLFNDPRILITIKILAKVIGGNLSLQFLIPLPPVYKFINFFIFC